jgi:hypothetical protein
MVLKEDYHSFRGFSFHYEWIQVRFCSFSELIENVKHATTNARRIKHGCNKAARHFVSCRNKVCSTNHCKSQSCGWTCINIVYKLYISVARPYLREKLVVLVHQPPDQTNGPPLQNHQLLLSVLQAKWMSTENNIRFVEFTMYVSAYIFYEPMTKQIRFIGQPL